jgi:tetratricopeptide (TPR) repeat protein
VRSPRFLGAIVFLFALTLPADVMAQLTRPPAGADSSMSAIGKIIVRVRGAGGASLPGFASVRLYSNFSSFSQTSSSLDNSQAVFGSVPIGEYQVEVRAPGYRDTIEVASLLTPNSSTYVFVDLLPEGPPGAAVQPDGPPLLSPKAQKELEAAAAALRLGDIKLAQKLLDKAQKMAPGHPDVYYLQALLFIRMGDTPQGRASLERAVNIYPNHAAAQSMLGALLYNLSEYPAAITALEKAVQLEPQSWQAHRSLALCYLNEKSWEKARAHVERALETSGNKAPELRLLFARVLMAMREFEKAKVQVREFQVGNPGHPDLPEANRLMAALKREERPPQESPSTQAAAKSPAPGASKSSADSHPELFAPPAGTANRGGLAVDVEAALPEPGRAGSGRWAPPAVDEALPLYNGNVSCSLPAVLAGAGRRATSLAGNLERISASERIENADLDGNGNRRNVQVGQFNYLVSIIEVRPGFLAVEEDRRPLHQETLSTSLLSRGLGALALIFHPYYAEDFEMRCEGLTEWHGQAAWSVYFRQRADRPSRVRSYSVGQGRHVIPLKGRALISSNSFQVLRMETDLVEPVKPIQLELEHLIIEYGPVDFKTRTTRLWLPLNAQLYRMIKGKRHFTEHSFSNYMIFSVDLTHREGVDKKP